MNLIQSFENLQAKSPELNSAFASLVESTGSVRKLAASLAQKAGEHQSKIQSDLQEVEEVVQKLRQAAEECRTGLTEEMTKAETGIRGLADHFPGMKDEILSGVTRAEERMSHLQECVSSGEQVLQTSLQTVEEAVNQFHSQADEGEGGVRDLASSIRQELETLGHEVESLKDSASDKAGELSREMAEAATSASAKFGEFVDAGLGKSATMLDGELSRILSTDVQGAVQNYAEQLQRQIGEELQTRVDEIVESTVQAVETRVRDVIFGEADKAGSDRSLMEPAVNALMETMEPVTDALHYIKNLASSVGISL